MIRYVLSNLDFEYELAGVPTPSEVAGFCQRWRSVLRLLPEAREAECLDPLIGHRVEGPVLTWGATARVSGGGPGLSVVRKVHDKRYSHALEVALGCALEGSRVVGSVADLEAAVAQLPTDWVLKHPMGTSGRDRMLGRRGALSDSARGWARRKFSQGWTLLLEPWVADRVDFSLHYDIAEDGTVHYRGACLLVPDRGGVYRGNRVSDEARFETARPWVERALGSVAADGYHGPIGIDGFLCGDGRLRPIVELNARYTFGRMALALREWTAGLPFVWWHPQVRVGPGLTVVRPERGRYRLPTAVDPMGTSGTMILVGDNEEDLEAMWQCECSI